MLTIRNHNGDALLTLEIGKGSKRVFSLMKEDYISLKFSLAEPLCFGIGSYVIIDGFGRFELTDLYQPKQNTKTGGWDYDIKFNAHYIKWKNKVFKYTPENASGEASWNLTASLDVHMGIFLRNLVALGYNYSGQPYTFSIDGTVSNTARLVTYENKNLLDSLYEMADKFECEVWVEDSIIHFGRCEFGDAIEFEQGLNVESMTAEGNRQTYATRIYVFGADRNLPKDYRPTAENITVNGVVQKRLMLPVDTPYIDSTADLATVEAVEQVLIFDDVYPRTKSSIVLADPKEYDVIDENNEPTGDKWKAYRFTLPGFEFSEEYILPATQLQLIFQTGSLAGMTFDVKFNPEGESESDPSCQLWEIVRNENYGRPLPDEILKPQDGNEIVLVGWDSTKIESLGLIASAEQELKQKAIEKISKLKIDPTNYRCKMISAAMFDNGGSWHLHTLGSRVLLKNQGCFDGGERESRIIGYEYDLAQPFNSPIYIVGEKTNNSRTKELESKVEALTLAGQTYTGGNGRGVYIIRTNDTTPPSDTNAFSALRAKIEHLSRLTDDTAQGRITFAQGLISLLQAELRQGWRTEGYDSSLYTGRGAGVDADGNMAVESIKVRSRAEFMELVINRIQAMEADYAFTEGDIIERADDLGGGVWGLWLRRKWEGNFTALAVGDVVRGIINTLAKNHLEGADTPGAYYTSWMRVNSVNQANNYVQVALYPDEQCPAGENFPPCSLMAITRWGNQNDENADRQSSWYISSREGRLTFLEGVHQPKTDPQQSHRIEIGRISDWLRNILTSKGFGVGEHEDVVYAKRIITTEQPLVVDIATGEVQCEYVEYIQWEQGMRYYCRTLNPETGRYETSRVWHIGCLWQCCVDGTEQEPRWNSTDWLMIQGNADFTVEFVEKDQVLSCAYFYYTLTIKAKVGYDDVTADIHDADVEWTRTTWDDNGNERVASDNAWAIRRAGSGKQLTITPDDADNQPHRLKRIRFTAKVTLMDGHTASVSFG